MGSTSFLTDRFLTIEDSPPILRELAGEVEQWAGNLLDRFRGWVKFPKQSESTSQPDEPGAEFAGDTPPEMQGGHRQGRRGRR